MVKTRLDLESEVQEIFECIDSSSTFLLSGGAGSGKTYSLVQVIRQAISENPSAKVACMTYTNAAVREIEERVSHQNLSVSTIHDFLWDNIKHFQKELKCAIISLANNGNLKISLDYDGRLVPETYFDNLDEGIQYKEYLKLKEGIISHDELLLIANYLFEKYDKLGMIIKDKYQFIFIDEYQDTNFKVIDIFLKHLVKSPKNNIIGFFGDTMQAIYDSGVGNLDDYKGDSTYNVKEIQKTQNRRNPSKIIKLANKLRTDGIEQEPSKDEKAPNMLDGNVKEGQVLFFHSTDGDISKVRDYLAKNYEWDFNNTKETKELNLTHNLIADKAKFGNLMDIYDKDPIIKLKDDILKQIEKIAISENDTFDVVVDKFQLKNKEKQLKKDVLLKDPFNNDLYNQLKEMPFLEVRKIYLSKDALIDDKKQDEKDQSKNNSKRDNLIKHLFKIENNIMLYKAGKYNEFLRTTDYRHKIDSIEAKKILKTNIESLINVGDKTIEDVIKDADKSSICLIDDNLNQFMIKSEYIYNRVKAVKYSQFQKLYNYLEGKTPFSTQHKTKGAEFENVLVILDNGNWNNYNFEHMFLNQGKASVLERTQKIFYVCCTRAKNRLAVFYYKPSNIIIEKAIEWFGSDNIITI